MDFQVLATMALTGELEGWTMEEVGDQSELEMKEAQAHPETSV